MPRALRVLFVDPYPDAAESYALLARLWGHEAEAASDAAQALALAERAAFDAAVIDPSSPALSGLACRLRGLPGQAGALLVAVGSKPEGADFDLVLRKPCHPELLRALLDAR